MSILFIDAAFREGSRTNRLAQCYLSGCKDRIERIALGECELRPLNRETLSCYNEHVAKHDFSNPLFDAAKQFAKADEIVISTPFWNFGIPAVLHDYLELVCAQGVTFDLDAKGNYVSLCHAKKLVYLTTAGGPIPENDHAFGYVKLLAEFFWHIENIEYYKADGLDICGTDVEAKLSRVCSEIIQNRR